MNDAEADPAKKRFFILQMIRFSGVVMAFLGAAIVAGKIELPPILGYFLLLNGMVDLLVIPQILAKKWKSSAK